MTLLTGTSVLRETSLPGAKLFSRGKVRDVYEVSGDRLLVVATDRLSAFDVVMTEGIPGKGAILTQLSVFWFNFFSGVVPHHFLTANLEDYPAELQAHSSQLEKRSMLAEKAKPFPIECVVRGYLAGSGWKDYQSTGTVCGVKLPAGLQQSSKLPEPIFTPATKAPSGHDENISWEEMVRRIGAAAAEKLRDYTLTLYSKARDYSEERGILLADTKFEFGERRGEIILIDEVLTPDSSRFWEAATYQPGRPQASYDKQYVRDWLEAQPWGKTAPGPRLPPEVVDGTRRRYIEAFERITGASFARYLEEDRIAP